MNLDRVQELTIKYLPLIVIYVLLVSFGFYGTAIRQKRVYEEYNDMRGTVTSFSVNMSGTYLCSIRLDNGMRGTVNNGCNIVAVDDTWINHIEYNGPIFGMCGYAYFIVPQELRGLFELIITIILVTLPVIGFALYGIGYFSYHWIKTH